MIRNGCKQIPLPAQDNNGQGTQTIKTAWGKTAQAENEEDNTFPTDGH